MEQPVSASGAIPRLLLATAGPAEHLARLLDLGEPRVVRRGEEILAAARAGAAGAAVVGEALEEMSALELVRALRAGYAGADLPLIVVADHFTDPGEEQALEAGADEFVDAAQVGARLRRRLRARLRLAWRRQESNPLTGLPGAGALGRELAARLPSRGRLAVAALDLRHFKAFNDRYGYARGDELLRLLRDSLLAVLAQRGAPGDFVAHLGGDDFFLLTAPERLEPLVAALQEKFDQQAATLYDRRDQEAGGITVVTRTGEKRFIPVTRLLAVAVTNESAELRHPGEVSAILAELKEYARRTENPGLIRDRRLRLPGPRPGELKGE